MTADNCTFSVCVFCGMTDCCFILVPIGSMVKGDDFDRYKNSKPIMPRSTMTVVVTNDTTKHNVFFMLLDCIPVRHNYFYGQISNRRNSNDTSFSLSLLFFDHI